MEFMGSLSKAYCRRQMPGFLYTILIDGDVLNGVLWGKDSPLAFNLISHDAVLQYIGNMVLALYWVDHELIDFLMKILIVRNLASLPLLRRILCTTSRRS